MQIAAAGPIGALFGLAYGTSIRIGYEIIFPALFADKVTSKDVDATLDKMTTTFTAIGGLEAQKFGINTGIKDALKAINADPELMELIKKNSAYDTLNITVNKSGNLETDQDQGSSTPPQLGLSDETQRIRNRYAAYDRPGQPSGISLTTAEILAREKRYETGDSECTALYGNGWIVTGSYENCTKDGKFLPNKKLTNKNPLPITEQEIKHIESGLIPPPTQNPTQMDSNTNSYYKTKTQLFNDMKVASIQIRDNQRIITLAGQPNNAHLKGRISISQARIKTAQLKLASKKKQWFNLMFTARTNRNISHQARLDATQASKAKLPF